MRHHNRRLLLSGFTDGEANHEDSDGAGGASSTVYDGFNGPCGCACGWGGSRQGRGSEFTATIRGETLVRWRIGHSGSGVADTGNPRRPV